MRGLLDVQTAEKPQLDHGGFARIDGWAKSWRPEQIADRLDAPLDTVRGWIRRARRSAHQLWTLGVAAVVALDHDALPTCERSDPLAAALDALAAAAFAVRRRFGPAFGEPWSTITVLTRGRLLAPASTG